MKRVNEHYFVMNGEQYHLSFFEKPILKKNGVEQKVKPVLREYITKFKLPIHLVNSNGNEEVPWTLARKILEYFSKKQTMDGVKCSLIDISNSIEKENKESLNEIPLRKMVNRISVDELFKAINEKLDWNKIQKSHKKLLIIACSDTKTPGGSNMPQNNCFENQILYNNLISDRKTRNDQYDQLFITNPIYFTHKDNPPKRIKRGNIPVVNNYFSDCRNNNHLLPAMDRYAGGTFYSQTLRNLYNQKNQQSNLHILIISGLYGIVEFRDSIIDYHLKIDKINFWTKNNNTSIRDTVKKYIQINEISDDMVFYSLAPSSYRNALKPINQWTDLWIAGGRSTNSVKFLEQEFLPRL